MAHFNMMLRVPLAGRCGHNSEIKVNRIVIELDKIEHFLTDIG